MQITGMLRSIALGAVLAALALPAAAADRTVEIVNATGYTIVEFYGSNTGTNDWEEDILGEYVLAPGETIDIDFDDNSDYCMFDFKAVFEDGDEVVEAGVDVCTVATFTFQ